MTPLRHILSREDQSAAGRAQHARWLMNQWVARAAELRARLAEGTRSDGRPYAASTMETYRAQLRTLERLQRDAAAQLARFESAEQG